MLRRRSPVYVLSLVAALTIPAFALQHWSPAGLPTALGCSGAGNVPVTTPGWFELSIWANPLEAQLVASDGFFVIGGSGNFADGVDVLETLSVKVTMGEGVPVAGELRLLSADGGRYLVGWSATSPLAESSTLSAEVVASSVSAASPGARATLVVSGEPTPLSSATTGSLLLGDWERYGRGVGQGATCLAATGPGSCSGNRVLQLPASDEAHIATYIFWQPPAVNGLVAWEARLEQEVATATSPPIYAGGETPPPEQGLGRLLLPPNAEEYCATLIIRDLRTGDEVSIPQCGAVGELRRTQLDYPLSECADLPGAVYQARWCELYPSKAECQDQGGGGSSPAGGGNTAGTSGGGGGAGGAELSASPGGPRTAKGCQVAVPAGGGGGAWAALSLGLTALLRASRRR